MSVVINGVKMPKSCFECWALDDNGDYPRCRITQTQKGYNFPTRKERMDDCPLVDTEMLSSWHWSTPTEPCPYP